MRVLLCHNFYQQPGGEDQVFRDEGALLESRGHEVVRYTLSNDAVNEMSKVALARKTLWNKESAAAIRTLIHEHRPDVMHCTNIFPLISPAAYYVAREEGVAVVQSLHNYRTLCPKAVLMRDGAICEQCIGKSFAWPAVVHSCYRDNRSASAAVAAMLAYHRTKQTWLMQVDRFIALTEFSKHKHIEGGLPADKIDVKPNFVSPDPQVGPGDGDYAVFVGRLSEEKGVATLLAAWTKLPGNLRLKIVGDGPLAAEVEHAVQSDPHIEWLGHRDLTEVCDLIGRAACLVMPSVCYETFGRTIVEAFAKGTPVVASRLGAMEELVEDGRTGFLFEAGNPDDLAEKVQRMIAATSDAGAQVKFRSAAREQYVDHFTPEANYGQLLAVYERALAAIGSTATGSTVIGSTVAEQKIVDMRHNSEEAGAV